MVVAVLAGLEILVVFPHLREAHAAYPIDVTLLLRHSHRAAAEKCRVTKLSSFQDIFPALHVPKFPRLNAQIMSCSTATSRPSHPLRILIVGSGGREHAYAWKLSQSPSVQAVFVAPGNGGSAPPLGEGEGTLAKITNANVKGNDYPGLVKFGVENGVNLVVPGPEAPLVDGIEGHFRAGGFTTQAPSSFERENCSRS